MSLVAMSLDDAAAARLAGRLLDLPVLRTDRLRAGVNNQIWRITSRDGTSYALKRYPLVAGDQRDRFRAETEAFRLLAAAREPAVPNLIAASPEDQAVVMEWIDGAAPRVGDPAFIAAGLAFVGRLAGYRRLAAADGLGDAAEACPSLWMLLDQISGRIGRLRAGVSDEAVRQYLDRELGPLADRAGDRAMSLLARHGWSPETLLAPDARIPSPSDFGLHNSLRRRDGGFAFVDFEYFGWDDPVKLIADFMVHPAGGFGPADRRQVRRAATAAFSGDVGFSRRLNAMLPLFALRWALILLNDFLPERQSRRVAAGVNVDDCNYLGRQLRKSRDLLPLCVWYLDGNE